MRKLIVNADDFGFTEGINKGIIEAHRNGIVTSTSLMVNGAAVKEAVYLSKHYPLLGLGLHFQITKEELKAYRQVKKLVAVARVEKTKKEFVRQIEQFRKLTGKLPDHIDGHHHVHKLPRLYPYIKNFARAHDIPLRDDVNFIMDFFGDPNVEKISKHYLIQILKTLPDGTSELMCHPAKSVKELNSSYSSQRLVELETLTSDKVKTAIKEQSIKLISWSSSKPTDFSKPK